MACNRCGAAYASDGSTISAEFDAQNGQRLYLTARLIASIDPMGLRAAMFCPQCWVFFLETFGRRATAERVLHG